MPQPAKPRRFSRLWGWLVGLLLALVLAAAGVFWWLASQLPGAGALRQQAPDTVAAGQPFDITVRAAVWGGGGPVGGRYTDMQLQLLQDGRALGPALVPVASMREADQLVFRFRLQAPPLDGPASATLHWQLRFRLDGQAQQVAGPQTIQVRP